MKNKVLIIMILLFVSLTNAQIKKWDNPKLKKPIQIEQWQVNDLVFKVEQNIKSPFSKNVYALVNDGIQTQKVPLFYNGDNNWVFRYSSNTIGQKSFQIEGDIKELSKIKGLFSVMKNKQKMRHGAIKLNSENPQHFYYEDGTPYFLLAFECDWLYALDYHNKKETPKTEHLLNLIEENGFNQIVMNVFSYDVSWKKDDKLKAHPEHEFGGPKDIFPFLGNNDNPDYSSLNPEFFQKLDRTISLMHDKNIVSHLMIYVWNKLVAWPDMNSEADNMYFDYVIKRYQAFPNMVWDISKEALYYGRADEPYIHGRIERARKLDSYNRLLSVHDFKYCSRHPEKVDFISTQNWSHNIYDKMVDAKNKFKNKPIFNIEHGGYEASPYVVFTGDYTNAEVCLRRNYMCLFAGVYTTYYWQGASWNVIIYNPLEQPENIQKPKFEYFKHMKKLFSVFDFSTMKPTPWQNGSAYNLTDKDDTVLLYIHKENYGIDAAFLKKNASKRNLQWFNTLSGEFSDLMPMPKSGKLISPWSNDADSIIISRLK